MAQDNKSGNNKTKQRAYVGNARDNANARREAKRAAEEEAAAKRKAAREASGRGGTAKSGTSGSASGSTGRLRNASSSRSTAGSGNSAAKKSTGARSGSASSNSRSSGRNSSGTGRNANEREYEQLSLRLEEDNSLRDEIIVIVSLLAAVLMVLSYLNLCGRFGDILNTVIFGLFGTFGYVFPIVVVFVTVFALANKRSRSITLKTVFCICMMLFIAGLIQMAMGGFDDKITLKEYFSNSIPGYEGDNRTYGGFFGGAVCMLLCPFMGKAGSICTMVAAVIIFFLLIAGKAIFTEIGHRINDAAREREIRREEEEEYYRLEAERQRAEEDEEERGEKGRRNDFEDEFGGIDEAFFTDDPDAIFRSRKKEKKGNFVDSLMRMGMGLDVERMADTPEYKDIKEQYTGQSDAATERDTSVTAQASGEDSLKDNSSSGNEQAEASADMNEIIDESAGEQDIISMELKRKFGNKQTIDVPVLHEHPVITKTGMTRNVMVDEPEDSVVSMSSRAGKTEEYASESEGSKPGLTEAEIISIIRPDFKRADDLRDENNQSESNGHSGAENMLRTEESGDAGRRASTDSSQRGSSTAAASAGSSQRSSSTAAASTDSSQRGSSTATASAGSSQRGSSTAAVSAGSSQRSSSTAETETDDSYDSGDLSKRTSSGDTSFNSPEEIAKLAQELENKPEPPYVFPPLDLLNKSTPIDRGSDGERELESTKAMLQRTFESFNVGVTVTEATCGPTVTRYELLPDQGVKVKTITALADDIKLALAAAEIRIEAPIPGKAAVGIEVPNATTSPVLLRDLLESPEFADAPSSLTFAVGKDIGGKTICFDIASMPHMLIAGATGSGKSVCINALILSLIYKAKPSDVRIIMIDPKRVELIGYNGIPHLLVPVVTDVKKATGALNWAIAEMDDRYERFANVGVNNLKSYNRLMEERYYEEGNEGECPDRLPQIVIIVDELNDLMMTANSKEVEGAIVRLTQLARASGIHVVLATQRPSVNVITGTIKANIPSRIAFSVSSIVDSRTIIDQAGAEKLLGKGDMLFYPQGYPKPVRLQGAYVSDKEIAGVVEFIKTKCKEVKYSDSVSKHIEKNAAGESKGSAPSGGSVSAANEPSDADFDEFFERAGRFIIEKQKASIGQLQRVFKIGFNRAARIMDQLADEGVVGPEEGTKPRRIMMTMAQFEAYMAGEDVNTSSEVGTEDEYAAPQFDDAQE